jgi:hypothetical protein
MVYHLSYVGNSFVFTLFSRQDLTSFAQVGLELVIFLPLALE